MQGAIKIFLTNVTYQGLFLMKFFLLILYVLALVILAQVSKLVAEGFTNNVLFRTHLPIQTARTTSSRSTCRAEGGSRPS